MNRRAFLQTAAMAASMAATGQAWGAQKDRRPNFLIIVADDMGYADAGCYGGEIQTPNLDHLAENGVRFSQCYSTGRCWPSRSCILTGYYAQQVRMDPPEERIPEWARVIPHYLKPEGYRCYTSGKWHLLGAPKAIADGDFDHAYVIHDHDRFFSPKNHEEDDRKLPPVEDQPDYYLTTAIADHAIGCLKDHAAQHSDKPFFQYLAFTSPHFPLHALQKDIHVYRKRYLDGWDVVRKQRHQRQLDMGLVNCRLSPREESTIPSWNLSEEELHAQIGAGEVGYAVAWDSLSAEQKHFQATKMAIHAAMIHRMDIEIGRVLEQVKAMGAYDNTVVMFVSDNGSSAEQIIRGDMHDPTVPPGSAASYLCLGPGWSTVGNTPFRLHKHWNHEGGIASPLIVHWPAGKLPEGVIHSDPSHFIDLLPTMLDLADVQPSSEWNGLTAPPLPGRSMVPAFYQNGAVEREFLYFCHQGNRGLRQGDWKLVAAGAEGPWELYNLKDDRSEMTNLCTEYPERVQAMSVFWEEKDRLFRKQGGYQEKPG
jgi:arylsulfatase A-like enzyme